MTQVWTIKAALDWTVDYLEHKGDKNARLSAQWLLSEATHLSRIELYTHHDQPLSLDEREVLRGYVTRRAAGEPLQYITGEVGFRHITVKVRPQTLIPRPETEVLVSEVLSRLPDPAPRRSAEFLREMQEWSDSKESTIHQEQNTGVAVEFKEGRGAEEERSDSAERLSPSSTAHQEDDLSTRENQRRLLVADIGTGSGCIACSLAYEHPDIHVIAADISEYALSLASENVEALQLRDRIEVVASDIGEGIDPSLKGSFDAIVSNPPYIPTRVLDEIPTEVTAFEPSLALDGGTDGLDVLRRLLPFCAEALTSGGFFAFELFEGHLEEAACLAREAGFVSVEIKCDLTQTPRILLGVKA